MYKSNLAFSTVHYDGESVKNIDAKKVEKDIRDYISKELKVPKENVGPTEITKDSCGIGYIVKVPYNA